MKTERMASTTFEVEEGCRLLESCLIGAWYTVKHVNENMVT